MTEQIPGSVGEKNPIRYRGYYFDNETGYYYCQSRYYNPEWCRWISADVYMDTGDGIQGTNMYAYCQGDPVNLCDPSGYEPITLAILGTYALYTLAITAITAAGLGLMALTQTPEFQAAWGNMVGQIELWITDSINAISQSMSQRKAAKLVDALGGIAASYGLNALKPQKKWKSI